MAQKANKVMKCLKSRVEHGIMEQWGIMEHYKQTAPNPLIKTSKQLQR